MKKIMLLFFLLTPFVLKADSWTQKANFGGTARMGAIYFSIGNKGYIGSGTDQYPSYHFVNDIWEYDQATNTWTQMADFPGTARYTALAFALGSKGYVGTGWNGSFFNDLWQYNQTTNNWTQKGNFPGLPRQGVFTRVLNNKVYAGMGANSSNFFNDFYSYNDTTDTWTPLASFPGAARVLPFSFDINGKIYVGAGTGPSFSVMNDFWEYDPANNIWTQKTNFPGAPRFATVYFSINGKGYAGIGKNASITFYDFYVYDPVFNSWAQRLSFPDTSIEIEAGFTLGSLGYAGCGMKAPSNITKQFWEYTPDGVGIEENFGESLSLLFFPNPATSELTIENGELKIKEIEIYSSLGENVFKSQISGLKSQISIDVSQLLPGIYFITVTDEEGNKVTKKVVKM
jgi:N-acetylneuraminic acid mutarotase